MTLIALCWHKKLLGFLLTIFVRVCEYFGLIQICLLATSSVEE